MGTSKRERQKQGRQARIAAAQAAAARRKRLRTGIIFGLLVVGLIGLSLAVAVKDDDDNEDVASGSSTSSTASTLVGETTSTTEDPANVPPVLEAGGTITGDTPCPAADGSAERTTTFSQPPPTCIETGKTYTATFDTTAGEVKVALDTETTPIAANNFIVLSRYHYYDGTVVTRTATGIDIIQGGSPHTQTNGDPGPGYTIEDEGFEDDIVTGGGQGPYRYTAGDLVYARPSGTPDSSSAQFFFCVTDGCSQLDSQGIYVKFGHVTEGLEVLQAILADSPEGDARPNHLVTVNAVTIEES